MCRWFAYISATEPCLLDDVLVRPAHSLSKQVHEHYLPKLLAHHEHEHEHDQEHGDGSASQETTAHEISLRNRLFNVDGLGVAWYTAAAHDFDGCAGPRPALYKTVQPPMNDLNFRSLCANVSALLCMAHIRASSATATTIVNNHPFVFGRQCFMHNGSIADFLAIRRRICLLMHADVYGHVQGATDSEHLAGLYVTYLTEGRGADAWEEGYSTAQMHAALARAVNTVIELQREICGPGAEASSLNLAASDGSRLVAFRFRNDARSQPPSLYYSTSAGVALNRKYPDHPDGQVSGPSLRKAEEHGRHVIVASEPSTYHEQDWTLIQKNQAVLVEDDSSMSFLDIPYTAFESRKE